MNTHGMNTHGMNTQRSNARPTSDRRQGRDAGTALPLVLVMIVIGSLWVLPVMSYAMSVFRANSVLSDKTSRLEAVKAGLRVSLSDPVSLYEECGAGGPTVGIPLATTSASGVIPSNSAGSITVSTRLRTAVRPTICAGARGTGVSPSSTISDCTALAGMAARLPPISMAR